MSAAEDGVEFENHVAAVPVCGPSRSSLLQGRFPHNAGYYFNDDLVSVANWLQQHNNTVSCVILVDRELAAERWQNHSVQACIFLCSECLMAPRCLQ